MATELAKAYVQIVPSAKGIKGSISEALGGEADSAGKSAGNTLGSSLASTVKKVIVAAGIGKAFQQAISEGANLEQSLGGVETLFKDSADQVKKYANEAYKTAGLSANSYMEQVTSFSASLLQSLGGDTSKAAEAANSAVIDMADNANKMGTSIESIQDAYQGFAKQNYTMLDNLKLGYGGTKTEMERLLADAEKISGVHYDINNLNDVYSAIHVIQGELGITGTTAEEAASTISGSLASMKSAFSNVLGTLATGGDVTSALTALGETVFTFVSGNLAPMVARIFAGLPEILNSVLSMAVRGINLLSNNADAILQMGIDVVTGLASAIISALPYLAEAALNLIASFGSALINTDWIQIGNDFISGLRDSMSVASGEIFGTDTSIISSVMNSITQHLPEVLNKGIEIVTTLVNGILQNLPSLISGAGQLISQFVDFILSNLPTILEAGANLLLNLVQGITENLPEIVKSAASAITEFLLTIGKHLPEILSTGAKILGKLIVGLIGAIPDLIASIPQIIAGIADTLSEYDWLGLGSDILTGIGKGITNAVSSVVEAAKNAAKSIFDSVKDFFDIGSPSKLMRDEIGRWIPAGIAVGIEKNLDPVTDAMDEITKLTTGTLNSDIEYGLSDNQKTLNSAAVSYDTRNSTEPIDYDRLEYIYTEASKNMSIKIDTRILGRVIREVMA